ncbi:hypothetical protein PYCC9005_005172 [Savitreella phatthalungensis]
MSANNNPPVDGSAARSDYAVTLNNSHRPSLPDEKFANSGVAPAPPTSAPLNDAGAAAYASSEESGNGKAGGQPAQRTHYDRRPSERTFQDLTGNFPIPYIVRPRRGPRRSPGNPSSLALFTFAITLGSLGVILLDGGIAKNNNIVGLSFFGGGFTLWVMALLELLQGNTYGATVLGGFSVFYLAFSATIIPWFGATSAYDATNYSSSSGVTQADLDRQSSRVLGIWYFAYGVFDTIVWLPTWRISVVFNFIIGILIPCFFALSIGQFIQDPTQREHWNKAGGAFAVASAVAGFYAGAAAIWNKDSVGFNVPVGEYVRKDKPTTDVDDEEYVVERN